MLLAVHDEAPHRLAIWVVGSSLTDCGRRGWGEGKGQWSISAFNQGSVAEAKLICWLSPPRVEFNAAEGPNKGLDWTNTEAHWEVCCESAEWDTHTGKQVLLPFLILISCIFQKCTKCETSIAKKTISLFSPLFVTNKSTSVTTLERENPLPSVTLQRDDSQNKAVTTCFPIRSQEQKARKM